MSLWTQNLFCISFTLFRIRSWTICICSKIILGYTEISYLHLVLWVGNSDVIFVALLGYMLALVILILLIYLLCRKVSADNRRRRLRFRQEVDNEIRYHQKLTYIIGCVISTSIGTTSFVCILTTRLQGPVQLEVLTYFWIFDYACMLIVSFVVACILMI